MRTARVSVLVVSAVLALPAVAQAAPFVVNDLGDGAGACPGTCTLRAAINAANATPGVADNIVFSAFGTITPATQLPDITDSVTIDGRNGGVPAIQIDGASAGHRGAAVQRRGQQQHRARVSRVELRRGRASTSGSGPT